MLFKIVTQPFLFGFHSFISFRFLGGQRRLNSGKTENRGGIEGKVKSETRQCIENRNEVSERSETEIVTWEQRMNGRQEQKVQKCPKEGNK